MGWSGGVFTRVGGTTAWENDRLAGTGIESTLHDTHDEDVADGVNNCLTKDGQNAATANLDLGGFKYTNAGAGALATDLIRVSQVQSSAFIWAGTTAGAANAQTLTLSPAITAYTAGLALRCKVGVGLTNTAAVTLNVNAVGAVAVVDCDGTALSGGEIKAGQVLTLIYDGTSFRADGIYAKVAYTITANPSNYNSGGTKTGFYQKLSPNLIYVSVQINAYDATGTPDLITWDCLPFTYAHNRPVLSCAYFGGYTGFKFLPSAAHVDSGTTINLRRYDGVATFVTGTTWILAQGSYFFTP